MVVSNDDIDAERISEGDLLYVGDTGIDRNDERSAFFRELLYAVVIQAIPFQMAVRDVVRKIRLRLLEKIVQHHAARDAVAIVVAPDGNALLLVDSLRHTARSLFHVEYL